MKLRKSIEIERKPEEIFELIDDPGRYPEFFIGITRWEPRSEKRRGVGAKYRVLMKVGSIEAGGTVRVTDRTEPKAIKWVAERGIRQTGRWRLEPSDSGTVLTLEIDYDLSGGPVGALVERLTGRIVGRNMWATLRAARRLLESNPNQSD
jgi:ribosome-associated toxin RatA of RatAB toxin-antitoxin module